MEIKFCHYQRKESLEKSTNNEKQEKKKKNVYTVFPWMSRNNLKHLPLALLALTPRDAHTVRAGQETLGP